jgi:hypothetical protein
LALSRDADADEHVGGGSATMQGHSIPSPVQQQEEWESRESYTGAVLLTQQAVDEHMTPGSGHASYREGHSEDEGEERGGPHQHERSHGSEAHSLSPWADPGSAETPTQPWQHNQPTPGLTADEAAAVAALAGPPSGSVAPGADHSPSQLQGGEPPEEAIEQQPEAGSGGSMGDVWAELQDGVLAALTARGGPGVFGLDPRARGRHIPGQQQAAQHIVQGLSSMGGDQQGEGAQIGEGGSTAGEVVAGGGEVVGDM